jgi:glutamine synthetase
MNESVDYRNKLQQIVKKVKEEGIEFLRILYIDNTGIVRGRMSNTETIEQDLQSGTTFAACMQSGMGILDAITPGSVFGSMGEARLIPDLDTFRIVPYAEKAASVIGDFYTSDMDIFRADPRPLFKEYLRTLPFQVVAAFENEFYLLTKAEDGSLAPVDNSLCFATRGMNTANEFAIAMKHALEVQEITVERYYPEYGPGQQELTIRHKGAIRAADDQIIFRETARALAEQRGLIASFMPKLYDHLPGSGVHIHVSIWENGRNLLFDDSDENGLSELGYHFLGGVLAHMDALLAFTAPTVNSYKRLLPQRWASAYTCYGFHNREAACRIPLPIHPMEEKTTNIEIKPVDGTGNPYLSLGSIIAAGMDGINRRLDPGRPVLRDPVLLTEEERQQRGIRRYPENLREAVRALETDTFFRQVWGDLLIDEYIAIRKFEWDVYYQHVSQWERDTYAQHF